MAAPIKARSGTVTGVLFCLFLLAHIQCGTTISGGNSSETTNVSVVTSDGRPAVGAAVKLIDADNWAYLAARQKSVVIDSAIVGPEGVATFARLPAGRCNLQIDHTHSGVVVAGFCREGKALDETDSVTLRNYATFQGRCGSDTNAAAVIMLDGTAYRSIIGADRSFLFDGVAPDPHSMVLGSSDGKLSLAGSALLLEGKALSNDAIVPDFENLLIDDFESGDSSSVLGRIINGYWYTYVDTQDGGHSTITKTIQQGAPNGTVALNAEMVLGADSGFGSYAGVGIYIGTQKTDWDFSTMSAISFWARGKNIIRVSLESRLVDSVQNWPDFGTTIVLDSTWRHYVVPVDSFNLRRNSKAEELGITWEMASERINKIEFEASKAYSSVTDSIKLQLDDIRIVGVSVSDLFLQLEKTP